MTVELTRMLLLSMNVQGKANATHHRMPGKRKPVAAVAPPVAQQLSKPVHVVAKVRLKLSSIPAALLFVVHGWDSPANGTNPTACCLGTAETSCKARSCPSSRRHWLYKGAADEAGKTGRDIIL
jgi:hypothetical protein